MPHLEGKHKCIIVGAAPCDLSQLAVGEGDFVIGADGGCQTLNAYHIPISFAVGDWDSGNMPQVRETRTVPVEKDDTDMMLAVKEGLKRGYTEFHLYGGMGGSRTDHTLANIQTLIYLAHQGATGYLYGKDETITVLTDGEITYHNPKERLSVFASGEANGVSISGVKYPAENISLSDGFPLGVSHRFTGSEALIKVQKGTLIIVTGKDI